MPSFALPPFPNVPNAPGVPQVARDPKGSLFNPKVPPTVTPAVPATALTGKKYWGVFDNEGRNRLLPDSILELKSSDKTKISNFPVEKGAFATYNKVAEPTDQKLKMVKAGTLEERREFMDKLLELKMSVELFHIVTPERTFLDVNMQDFDYSQARGKGQNMLVVETHFLEIRQVEPAYGTAKLPPSKVKNPAAANAKNGGHKQKSKFFGKGYDDVKKVLTVRRLRRS